MLQFDKSSDFVGDNLPASPVEILAALPPAWSKKLLPYVAPWVAKALRTKIRDAALLAALDACDAADPTVRACELERRLTRYLTGPAWKAEQSLETLPEGAPEMACRIHALARANDGKALGWSRIYGIARAATAKFE